MLKNLLFFRYLHGVDTCSKSKLTLAGKRLRNITNKIMNQENSCLVPCQFTYLSLDHTPPLKNDKKLRSFTFNINPINTLTKSTLNYDLWTFIAELGGWVGLFVGLSVPDMFDNGFDFLEALHSYI